MYGGERNNDKEIKMLAWLKLLNYYYFLTAGLIPHNNFINYEDKLCFAPAVMYHINIATEISSPKNIFYIGGGFENYYVKTDKKMFFTALQDAFIFKTGIRYLNFELGYQHYCTHPLAFSISNSASMRSKYGSYDEIFVKLTNKGK